MIEENKDRICKLLSGTGTKHLIALLGYLSTETDYFTAPASAKHHHVCEGGLAAHSLDVYELTKGFNQFFGQNIPSEDVVIASLLHDLCKTNYYALEYKWRKDECGRWESYEAWGVKDCLPLGHGEKSLYLVSRFIDLGPGVAAAIRWHMGAWSSGVTTDYAAAMAYNSAVNRYPLVRMLIMADFAASRDMLVGGGNDT